MAVNVDLDGNYRGFIHDGVPLNLVSVDRRELSKSIKQQSHIKLSPLDFEAIKKATKCLTHRAASASSCYQFATSGSGNLLESNLAWLSQIVVRLYIPKQP